MKASHSEKFYRENWEHFIKNTSNVNYINLEQDLKEALKPYKDLEIPKESFDIITKVEAEKIYKKAVDFCKNEMIVVKKLNTNNCSLGYTTDVQEINNRYELITRFEFNCLQLADFKKKYNIEA